jgi:hypothetical protein
MHFWITWFPFWSRTHRITCPSNSDTNWVCWSTLTTSSAWTQQTHQYPSSSTERATPSNSQKSILTKEWQSLTPQNCPNHLSLKPQPSTILTKEHPRAIPSESPCNHTSANSAPTHAPPTDLPAPFSAAECRVQKTAPLMQQVKLRPHTTNSNVPTYTSNVTDTTMCSLVKTTLIERCLFPMHTQSFEYLKHIMQLLPFESHNCRKHPSSASKLVVELPGKPCSCPPDLRFLVSAEWTYSHADPHCNSTQTSVVIHTRIHPTSLTEMTK